MRLAKVRLVSIIRFRLVDSLLESSLKLSRLKELLPCEASFTLLLVSAVSFRTSNTLNQRCVRAWGGFSHRFNSTRVGVGGWSSCSLPGLCSLFHVFLPSPLSSTRVHLDVCALLQLSRGLNFETSLSPPADCHPPGCLDDAEVARLPLRLHLPLKSCVTFQM